MDNILNQNIIKELGLDELPETERQKTILRIGSLIFQMVVLRVIEEMTDKDKTEFETLLSKKSHEETEILDFLQKRVTNLDVVINEEVAKFKQEMIGTMNQIKR